MVVRFLEERSFNREIAVKLSEKQVQIGSWSQPLHVEIKMLTHTMRQVSKTLKTTFGNIKRRGLVNLKTIGEALAAGNLRAIGSGTRAGWGVSDSKPAYYQPTVGHGGNNENSEECPVEGSSDEAVIRLDELNDQTTRNWIHSKICLTWGSIRLEGSCMTCSTQWSG
ncbi:hypothetical protein V2G26_000681 [Clonostachys chloroleuca]